MHNGQIWETCSLIAIFHHIQTNLNCKLVRVATEYVAVTTLSVVIKYFESQSVVQCCASRLKCIRLKIQIKLNFNNYYVWIDFLK